MPFPNHLCLATATHSYKGDGSTTASIAAGRWVLVQGDRNDAPEGWCYALVEGQSAALLPISYLSAHEPGDFTAKALYDFTATEENELSLISGDYLLVEPSAADPSGWVTAVNKQSRERGFVPQAYIAPAGRAPTSAKKPPPPSSPIKQPPSNRADGVDGGGGSSSSWLDEQQLGEAGRSEVEELAAAGARHVAAAEEAVLEATAVKAKAEAESRVAASAERTAARAAKTSSAAAPSTATAKPPAAGGRRRFTAAANTNNPSASSSARHAAAAARDGASSHMARLYSLLTTRCLPALLESAKRATEAASDRMSTLWAYHLHPSLVRGLTSGHDHLQDWLLQMAKTRRCAPRREVLKQWAHSMDETHSHWQKALAASAPPPAAESSSMKEEVLEEEWAREAREAAKAAAKAAASSSALEDFEPQSAMDQIFHLGILLARGDDGSAEDDDEEGSRLWLWRITTLKSDLSRWHASHTLLAEQREVAACILQARARGLIQYKSYQTAISDVRARRALMTYAAIIIQTRYRGYVARREYKPARAASSVVMPSSSVAELPPLRVMAVEPPSTGTAPAPSLASPRSSGLLKSLSFGRGASRRRGSSSSTTLAADSTTVPPAPAPAEPQRGRPLQQRSLSFDYSHHARPQPNTINDTPAPQQQQQPIVALVKSPARPGSAQRPLIGRKIASPHANATGPAIDEDESSASLSPEEGINPTGSPAPAASRHAFDRKGMIISTETPRAASTEKKANVPNSPRSAAAAAAIISSPARSAGLKIRRSLSFGSSLLSPRRNSGSGLRRESGAPAAGTVDLTARTTMLFD